MQRRRLGFKPTPLAASILALTGAALPGVLLAAPTADPAAPAAASVPTTTDLDQRVRILERQLEIQQEDAAAKAKETYTTKFDEKGLSIKSPKGDWEFKFRGLLQADARFYTNDFNPTGATVTAANHDSFYTNDTFLLRRVEPTFELTIGKLLFFRLQPQFAGDTASTSDVYGELRFLPQFIVRFGKFKGPVSLENLQATGAITFIERGFPTELGPNRDLGIQVGGTFLNSRLSYAVGIFNGAPDGRDANGTSDPDNKKEIGARLFAEPFKNDPGPLQGLGFGVGGTRGPKNSNSTSVANDFLPRYRTPGQLTFFSYQGASGTDPATLADGTFQRIEPQGYWYYNSLGVLAEYSESKQHVSRGTHDDTLKHKAWQVVTNYFLTGEDAAYTGLARVNQPFAVGAPGWGAFEVAARYGVLDIDNDAFEAFADPGGFNARFANPATQASKAKAWTLAFNWYPTVNFKLAVNYSQTSFDGGAATGDGDRNKEKALFTRFQINF